MIIPRGPEYQGGAPAVSNHNLGNARLLRAFDNNSRDPSSHGIRHKAMAVGLRSANSDVERAPIDAAAVNSQGARVGPGSRCLAQQIGAPQLIDNLRPGQSAHTTTVVPGVAAAPAAGTVLLTRPRPRSVTRKPWPWSSRAASRIGRPSTSGTNRASRSAFGLRYGQGTTNRAIVAAVDEVWGSGAAAVSKSAKRLRSIATRREANACCNIVRVTGAAVRPP